MPKRQRGAGGGASMAMEREQRPQREQRLYLILDDNPDGYSIREIRLSPPTSCQTRSSRKNGSPSRKVAVQRLPNPIIRIEARRGSPLTFAAIGTKIVMTQFLKVRHGDLLIPIYDVRHRGITFGPGIFAYDTPVYITMGNKLFSLDTLNFWQLSFEAKEPSPLDSIESDDVPWSWHRLPPPPFHMVDVNSYAVHSDGQTILVSTDFCAGDPDFCAGDPLAAAGTFTFDTRNPEWKIHGDWSLPFTGRAYFVQCLEAFVGLSNDPASLGHLSYCSFEMATRSAPKAKVVKENLFSDDPDETHVSARLLYTGRGSGFCLVQCVSVRPGNDNFDDKNLTEPHRYRLTTFSLSSDGKGDLTTGNTSCVQCYEVPRETSKMFIDRGDPVAFWL